MTENLTGRLDTLNNDKKNKNVQDETVIER